LSLVGEGLGLLADGGFDDVAEVGQGGGGLGNPASAQRTDAVFGRDGDESRFQRGEFLKRRCL